MKIGDEYAQICLFNQSSVAYFHVSLRSIEILERFIWRFDSSSSSNSLARFHIPRLIQNSASFHLFMVSVLKRGGSSYRK